ncbi:MAG: EamA family transporter [Oscillospiraceae bacterium]|nr:EamA family transporter [Oscillospiraceae bacterium]
MKLFKDPRAMMAISMAVFGTIGFFVRNISVSSGELALYRAVLAALLIGAYLLITKQRIPFRQIGKEAVILLLSGAVMGVNWILFFQAFKYTTVSLATLSYYFAPVIVTVASTVLFREKLTGRQILCFVMSTIGLVLITGTVGLSGGSDIIGVLFGIGAAFLYATVILLNKFIKNVDGIHRTLLQFFAAIVVLAPYVALTGGSTLGTMDGKGWICLLVIGLVHTGVFYCVYFSAMKDLPGQKTAILSYIDPLVAVIVSVAILGEPITLLQAIGGLLILGFTLLNELSPGTASENEK